MTDRRQELESWIINKVAAHWSSTGKAFLLSRLGYEARQQFPDLPEIAPVGLKRFLSTVDGIQTLTHPTIPQMVGAAPVSAYIENPVTALVEEAGERKLIRRPRFNQELWKAFYTSGTKRRFVLLPDGNNPRISIVESDSEIENSYEILSSDLTTTTFNMPLAEKVTAVEKKIRDWAHRNGIDVRILLDAPLKKAELLSETIGAKDCLKGEIFGKLSQLDQARIMVPLDIVIKLLEKNS